jgi:hypothetical protein
MCTPQGVIFFRLVLLESSTRDVGRESLPRGTDWELLRKPGSQERELRISVIVVTSVMFGSWYVKE